MKLGTIVDFAVAIVVLAIALSVASISLVAAALLVLYALLTVMEYDSARFRTVVAENRIEIWLVKACLLLAAIGILLMA